MAIDATAGGPLANSYATLAQAETYFLNRLNTDAWDDADPADQERALISATIWLDQFDYIGEIATDTQALKWPRIDDDVFDIVWDDDEIPPKLKYAQFEFALMALTPGVIDTSDLGVTGGVISSLAVGPVTVRYDTSSSIDLTQVPLSVSRFLKGLWLPAVLA